MRTRLLLALAAVLATVSLAGGEEPYNPRGGKVVMPFDFESKFDDGRYGAMVGDMFWKKLRRDGRFVLPEMVDIRDVCESHQIRLGSDSPLEDVKKIVRETFDADVAIWGSVERKAGNDWDVYDLVIRCVDFTTDEPQIIYEVTAQTKVVSEIPHKYAQQLLDSLIKPRPSVAPETNIGTVLGPNLVVGDFETGDRGVPRGWASVGGQQREPLGTQVRWTSETGKPSNKLIQLTFDKATGDSTGVMYYSDWFPVEAGAAYRFECRWRSTGPAAKVFVKCYTEMPSRFRQESGVIYVPGEPQRRECYRSQQNLKGPTNVWNVQREDFTPRHAKYEPEWGRVMLYGYSGAGTVEFDDVSVRKIAAHSYTPDDTYAPKDAPYRPASPAAKPDSRK